MTLGEEQTPTFSVGELNRLIRAALSSAFPREIWVQGEISSMKRHEASGNVYFELVDAAAGSSRADATLHVALYRSDRVAVNRQLTNASDEHPGAVVRMNDGIHIRIRGSVTYHPPTGAMALRMTAIDPVHTLGRLAGERDRVLAVLRSDGLIERNSLLEIPMLPLRLGLVTSSGSAAHADFTDELDACGLRWLVSLIDSRVQGLGADVEIAAALNKLSATDVDLIAIVRGGGARTDLMIFDSELVARAIAHSGVPVFTGIGHETDTSVADLVASKSFKTPTACASAIVALAQAAADRAENAWARISAAATLTIDTHERRLATTGRQMALRARSQLDLRSQRVTTTIAQLTKSASTALNASSQTLQVRSARVDAVDPARALARGWSITFTADGRVVRDVSVLSNGDELITQLATGRVRSRVQS